MHASLAAHWGERLRTPMAAQTASSGSYHCRALGIALCPWLVVTTPGTMARRGQAVSSCVCVIAEVLIVAFGKHLCPLTCDAGEQPDCAVIHNHVVARVFNPLIPATHVVAIRLVSKEEPHAAAKSDLLVCSSGLTQSHGDCTVNFHSNSAPASSRLGSSPLFIEDLLTKSNVMRICAVV